MEMHEKDAIGTEQNVTL